MARLTLEELELLNEERSKGNFDGQREKFFSLSDDGDSAIVRILHADSRDFDILTVHDVDVQGRKKRVNCLRTGNEPTAACPLCGDNNRPNPRIFIHMLQYTRDAKGNLETEHVVFDRGYTYAAILKGLINDYCSEGRPLYDWVFKITRMGAKGSTDTKYTFSVMPKFDANSHPYDEEDLKYSEVLGTIVWDKNNADMQTYVSTGDFPKVGGDNTQVTPRTTNNTTTTSNSNFPNYSVGERRTRV